MIEIKLCHDCFKQLNHVREIYMWCEDGIKLPVCESCWNERANQTFDIHGLRLISTCDFDCDCWHETSESTKVCANCHLFTSVTLDTCTQEQAEMMIARDLDILYVCRLSHYIKHAYSGCCAQFKYVKGKTLLFSEEKQLKGENENANVTNK